MWESDLPDAGRKVNLICKYREWLMFRVDGSVTSRRWTRKWRRKSVITKFQFPRNYFHDSSADWEQTEWNKARLLSINHHHIFGLLTKKPLHAHLDWDKFSVQLSVITAVARKNYRLPWHSFTTLCALNTSHHATNSHKSDIPNRAASRGVVASVNIPRASSTAVHRIPCNRFRRFACPQASFQTNSSYVIARKGNISHRCCGSNHPRTAAGISVGYSVAINRRW